MQKKLTGNFLLFGSPETDADVRYASGFCAPDPVGYLEVAGHKYLITSVMEAERARREVLEGIQVVTPQELGVCSGAKDSFVESIKIIMRKNNARRIAVTENCAIGIVEKLRKQAIDVIVLGKSPLLHRRAVKSDKEVALITNVQKVAVLTLKYIVKCIKQADIESDGSLIYKGKVLTSEFLRAEALTFMARYGCSSVRTIIACGKESANPHWIGYGKLYANQPIIIDIFPQDERFGYWGDLTRTVVKGKSPPLLKAMWHAVFDAQQGAMALINAGINAKLIHKYVCDTLRRNGFRTMLINGKMQGFIHSTGHGVGLAIHEYPTIGRLDIKLSAGNVVTIEPGLYYHRVGGVRIEDTVLITKTGCKVLYPAPYYFEV